MLNAGRRQKAACGDRHTAARHMVLGMLEPQLSQMAQQIRREIHGELTPAQTEMLGHG